MTKTLRLVLGDQLNSQHSWFAVTNPSVTYLMLEMRQETDYVAHHIQKVVAFFLSMRHFAQTLQEQGHQVQYLTLDDPQNLQDLTAQVH
jgi:deoxyribodipyrimidine photolyase-related protein